MPGTLVKNAVNKQKEMLVADNVLKQKVKTMEEADEARKLARAAERELQQRLSKELESAKLNALLVQESWRKIMRTIKVSNCVQTRRNSYAYSVSNSLFLTLLFSFCMTPLPFLSNDRRKSLNMTWKF